MAISAPCKRDTPRAREVLFARDHAVDVVNREHGEDRHAASRQPPPRSLRGALAVVGVEGAVDVHDRGALDRRVGERRRNRLRHGLVLHALREEEAVRPGSGVGGRRRLRIGGGRVSRHLRDEAVVVLAARRTLQLARREPSLRPERIERAQPRFRDVGRDRTRHVGGHDWQVVFARELDQRTVIGRVPRPRPRAFQELLFRDRSRRVLVEDGLHVALEHLERNHERHAAAHQPFDDGQLEPVRIGVVVLFAHEDHVGARHVGEHRLEVREALVTRVEDAVRDVPRRAVRRLQQGEGSEQREDHLSVADQRAASGVDATPQIWRVLRPARNATTARRDGVHPSARRMAEAANAASFFRDSVSRRRTPAS